MKYWTSLVVVAILLVVGGFVVYPKTPYFVYDSQNYFSTANNEVFKTKDNKIITVKTTSEVATIKIENDDAIIKITFEEKPQLYISKGDVTFTGNIEFLEEDVDQSLLKYANLAKEWEKYNSTIFEDFSFVIYLLSSIVLLVGLVVLIKAFKSKIKTSKITLTIALMLVLFTASVNIIIILEHL